MFDATTVNHQSLRINAINGSILKNFKDSFFLRFHLKSPLSNKLLSDRPTYEILGVKRPIVVLQLMLCGDMEVIAEVMFKEDYDKLFEEENG